MALWLTVVGIGEEGYAGLGKAARRALLAAEVIVGAPRQLQLLPRCIRAPQQTWPSPFSLDGLLARRGTPVCVLASGDPMLFGVGASLARQVHAAVQQFEQVARAGRGEDHGATSSPSCGGASV